jgi:hypothetical protein
MKVKPPREGKDTVAKIKKTAPYRKPNPELPVTTLAPELSGSILGRFQPFYRPRKPLGRVEV